MIFKSRWQNWKSDSPTQAGAISVNGTYGTSPHGNLKLETLAPPNPGESPKWVDSEIYECLLNGQAVLIWSKTINEWLFWVLGDQETKSVHLRFSNTCTYTLEEIDLMVRAKWGPQQLQIAHKFKRELGGKIVEP